MAFCANCGSEVSGRFCQKCGAPMGGPAPGPTPGVDPGPSPVQPLPPPAGAPSLGMTDNLAAALCYLVGFITGILFLVLAPYNQNRTIRFHAFQSIFLNIAWVIFWIVISMVSLMFSFVPFLRLFVATVLEFAVGLGGFILWLYLMFKAY